MTNAGQIVWEYLTASGTGLYGLVGARVWSPGAPVGWVNSSAALLFEVAAESGEYCARDVVKGAVSISCFGGTDDGADADAVYEALYDRLHGKSGSVASGQLVSAKMISGSKGDWDSGLECPMARALFDLRVM